MWRPSTVEPDAPVLWQTPLGDVHLRHDLDARDRPRRHPPLHGGDVVQDPVDPEAHPQLAPVGREVHVGGSLLDRLRDDLVDELDDRRVVGGLVQVDDLAAALFRLFDLAVGCSATTSSSRSRREIRLAMSSGGATATRTS